MTNQPWWLGRGLLLTLALVLALSALPRFAISSVRRVKRLDDAGFPVE